MKTFYVHVPLEGYAICRVEAENQEDAIEKIGQGDGDDYDILSEENTVFDPDTNNWEVEEVTE